MNAAMIETLSSIVTVAAGVWAIARWTAKVDKNTDATERLTAVFDGFAEKITDRVNEHEVRITVLEKSSGKH